MPEQVSAYVVISDIHAGCQLGLYPCNITRGELLLDEGGEYTPNAIQRGMWAWWDEFWFEHVPEMTNGLPYGVIVNGDSLDGKHHDAVHQITHNLSTQQRIAEAILRPIVDLCEGRFYMIRGTEAHVGPSGQQEEMLASSLGAIRSDIGQSARHELWKKIGKHSMVHIAHTIGGTSSQSYESTAVHKEYVEALAESARWGNRAPDAVVRSHRHRYFETMIATERGRGRGIVTPGWQARTPFAYKIAGGRNSQPQFGGVVLIESPSGEFYTRSKVWSIQRPEAE